jgi:hypothetical protein
MKQTIRDSVLFGLWATCNAGCADVGDPRQHNDPPIAPQKVSDVTLPATDAENVRIQKYIDSLYSRADVQHAFRTTLGQEVDCVDAYAQPAMKTPAMRGRSIATPPVHAPPPVAIANSAIEPIFGGTDENGSERSCPAGTVALARLTAEMIKSAGGLHDYLGHIKRAFPQAEPVAVPDSHAQNYAHVQGTQSPQPPNMHGASAILSVHSPQTSTANDHSLSQLWIRTGSANFNDAGGCTTGASGTCYQTLEAGWTVDPQLNGNSSPHLFTFMTWNGYADGAYNNRQAFSYQNNTYDSFFPWVPSPGAPYIVGQPLTANSVGSTPAEITLQWSSDFGAPDWWLYVNGTPIGYYPASLYTGAMADGANGWGIHLMVGGEVYAGAQGTDTAEMGTGVPAEWGYPYAAYQRNIQYAGRSQGSGFWAPFSLTSSAWYDQYPNCYDYSTSGGQSSWGTYFFFGGTSMSSEWWVFKSGCTPNFH